MPFIIFISIGHKRWVDYPPNSDAHMRPHCLLAHSMLYDRVQNLSPDEAKGVIWWLQIVAALEMKRSDKEGGVVKQLIGYLRQILREQPDHRFVFGFTLGREGPRCMSVCLRDRFGVLLTSTPIDIHKFPKLFIRIIASFAPKEVVDSYRLTSTTAFATDSYKEPTPKDGRQYKATSVAHARVMRGRATSVWTVVPLINDQLGAEVFVLKEPWRPELVESEGESNSKAKGSECEFLGPTTLHEDVVIDDMVDHDGQKPGMRRLRAESEERFLHVASTDDDEIDQMTTPRERDYVSRAHTRVIMSTFGWPLTSFATLKELFVVFLNGVQGHESLYEHGRLHRDISAGNGVLLTWIAQSWVLEIPERSLRLKLKMTQYQRLKLRPSPPQSLLILEDASTRPSCHYHYSPDVIPLRMMCRSSTLYDRGHRDGTVYVSLDILVFTLIDIKVERSFDFNPAVLVSEDEDKDTSKASRTGTPPYASAEVLGAAPVRYGTDSIAVPYQDAIHDIESFLWILVHICLTRSGPSGARRAELTEHGNVLRKVVYRVFNSDNATLALNKHRLFAIPSDFEKDIIGNFHPYFHPLKPLGIAMLEKAVEMLPTEDDDIVAEILEKRRKEMDGAF
ncbi:hypothetical protein CPB85DRAFT_1445878 [Mucidula mucida]|nr:hypothetical protein CPB85DRAFT_1445878 [Mucidula mucida]